MNCENTDLHLSKRLLRERYRSYWWTGAFRNGCNENRFIWLRYRENEVRNERGNLFAMKYPHLILTELQLRNIREFINGND
jgi:hypothetical protein